MKWFRKPSKKVIDNNSPYERCINCGTELDILKTTPIELREHYIIGSGQLCQSCFCDSYVKKDERLNVSDQELIYLLHKSKK